MSRAHKIKTNQINPDPLYKNLLLTRLINRVMESGKKAIAQKNVYQALEEIKKLTKKDPLEVFQLALENIKPATEVRPRRVGGASYQIPIPVRGRRRESLAIRWLVKSARARSNKENHAFYLKLAAEIIDASQKQGQSIAKKEEVHRTAEANKAFAHFRW